MWYRSCWTSQHRDASSGHTHPSGALAAATRVCARLSQAPAMLARALTRARAASIVAVTASRVSCTNARPVACHGHLRHRPRLARRRTASSAAAAAAPDSAQARVDVSDAAAAALEAIVGASRLSFADAVIQNHSSIEDGYHGWTPPHAVVTPSSTEQVREVVLACAEHRVPIVPYGAGTSVEGAIDCTRGGIMLDMGTMDEVLSVNDGDMDARVQAGVTREALNESIRHSGLFFSVDPGANATLGGMVSTNASGTTTLRYGNMQSNVLGLKAVLADGTIVNAGGRSRKSSAGYDLTRLLIGSEGTLGIVTEVQVKLHPQPDSVVAAVCQFESLQGAVDAVLAATYAGARPARMELLDSATMSALDGYQGQSFTVAPTIFFELHGTTATAVEDEAQVVQGIVSDYGATGWEAATAQEDRTRLWKARHDAFWAVKAKWPGRDLIATDVCVPVTRLAEIVMATQKDIADLGFEAAPIFGHVGDGNFHVLVMFDKSDPDEVARVKQAEHNLVHRALAMEGTCTGEHGIGVGKQQYLEPQFGPGAVAMMRTLKAALDPLNILNPDKVVPLS